MGYRCQEINNFKELLQYITIKYSENTAYRLKKVDENGKKYINKTYRDFYNDIKSLSTSLIDKDLKGQKIILIGNNSYEWCLSYLSITTSNMIVVPLDKALPEKEIENLVIRSDSKTVICDKKYEEIFKKLLNKQIINEIILLDTEENNSISKLIENGKKLLNQGNDEYDNIEINDNNLSIILFTSGTTNSPKAVMLSQKNICSNVVAIAEYVKLYEKDTIMSFLPLHHTFECTITFLYGIYHGVTIVFCDGLKHIQENLKEYKVTVFVAVPLILENMYKKILKTIETSGKERIINLMSKLSNFLLKLKIDLRKILFKQILEAFGGNLRVVLYGAAPMNKDTIIGFNKLGIDLIQGYGLTETSPVISAETDKRKKPGSVGLVLQNLKVKILDINKEGIGEIAVRGPSVMLGYYKNEEETGRVLQEGWFRTGDFGYLDDEGFLFVTGRKKDTIVLKNGKNVYPQEIEFLINKIPYVIESLVYQRQKNTTDTMLCAKIVYDKDIIKSKYGQNEELYQDKIWEDIKNINSMLPDFKHIKRIYITNEALEKTTTQKVKRYKEIEKISKR